MLARTVSFAALVGFATVGTLPAAEVGQKAPDLEPTEWLNTRGKTDWSSLKGRLLLIEKWATW